MLCHSHLLIFESIYAISNAIVFPRPERPPRADGEAYQERVRPRDEEAGGHRVQQGPLQRGRSEGAQPDQHEQVRDEDSPKCHYKYKKRSSSYLHTIATILQYYNTTSTSYNMNKSLLLVYSIKSPVNEWLFRTSFCRSFTTEAVEAIHEKGALEGSSSGGEAPAAAAAVAAAPQPTARALLADEAAAAAAAAAASD